MIGFEEFFSIVHPGRTPYPWQVRFAEASATEGPPEIVSVPTGAGKTAVLDALLWALACQAERPAHQRTVGCRTVWAIDRRILVDQVHTHACALAGRLDSALGDAADPLNGVAERLQALAGEDRVPLVATRWRGGIDDDEPLLSPTQPQVITSTVAQVGSRLLFRGYGVGSRSLGLQAGIIGCDTTICLDEAHLAQPFVETVDAVHRLQCERESAIALPPLNAITLTATPSSRHGRAIELDAADRAALGARLSGSKIARLDDGAKTDRERAARLAELAGEHVDDGAGRTACVVNTVRQAIAVHEGLKKRSAKEGWDLALLIGPQRPVDREAVLKGPADALFSDEPPERPLVCVATQTFEVGLDAEVEALVTESASASALVQRLGRLNRSGKRDGRATIVRDSGSWLYGEDEALAWEWLLGLCDDSGDIDVSVAALEGDETRPAPLRTPTAPALTEEIVGLLVQTNPTPAQYAEPDIEPLLRGTESDPVDDVAICWRADLRMDSADHSYRRTLIDLVPPQPSEKLTVSRAGARALLAALHPAGKTSRRTAMQAASREADVEGAAPDIKLPPLDEGKEASFLVVRRREVMKGALRRGTDDAISPHELASGDIIILPSELGSIVAGLGFLGVSEDDSTTDAAPDVRVQGGEAPFARISPEAIDLAIEGNKKLTENSWRKIAKTCRNAAMSASRDAVRSLVEKLMTKHDLADHPALSALLDAGEAGAQLRIDALNSTSLEEEELADDATEEIMSEDEEPAPSEDDGEGLEEGAKRTGQTWVIRAIPQSRRDMRSRRGQEIPTIAAHAEAVRARTSEYCDRLGLDPSLAAALELAARAHDHGKADRRIQDFFRGGVPTIGEEPIAKSVFGADRRLAERAAALAGLPRNLRHEITSAAILLDAARSDATLCPTGVDLSLVLFIVLGHHGCGQPFRGVPVGGDPPVGVYCDAADIAGRAAGDGLEDWASGESQQRFWEVLNRYGAWGASYLSALLMLADRTVSSEGR